MAVEVDDFASWYRTVGPGSSLGSSFSNTHTSTANCITRSWSRSACSLMAPDEQSTNGAGASIGLGHSAFDDLAIGDSICQSIAKSPNHQMDRFTADSFAHNVLRVLVVHLADVFDEFCVWL